MITELIPEWALLADPLPALCHQLQHDVEGGLIVVEDNYIFTCIG